ncbi:fimbria/pilus chaperone family protein [Enterobacter chengduensis]|uniref:fimbria/pilus chaperone family protein n=1 Tax=Enterobacter chengduensis TaxID=2494701 RepID=UPI0020035082|nr:fimbria/pilus chaperone family protein [Enterobacter chengduensis]MCK7452867.1 fimbria/pilus periplasmic chaperone [Enterobacter chengduensis]
MANLKYLYIASIALSNLLFCQGPSFAAGMVPETTLLLINEADHGGTMMVKNTDNTPSLLYTMVNDIAPDKSVIINVTQPVVRLEPGQEQQVRFVLETQEPMTVEHYKRVIFEGIPPKGKDKNVKVGINIRQDIPVLIHPKSLPVVTDAWTLLTWVSDGQTLKVKNTSAYVVRFSQGVTLQPSGQQGSIPKSFILPGETLDVKLDKPLGSNQTVTFEPASRYGIKVDNYTAPIVR